MTLNSDGTGSETYTKASAVDQGANWLFQMVSYATTYTQTGTNADGSPILATSMVPVSDSTTLNGDTAASSNQALVQTACYYQF